MDTRSDKPTFDSLTGLRDRITFFRDVRQHRDAGNAAHIVLIQLSRLIWVNRKYGVPAGDQLIRDIARYLAHFDPAYTAYRIANSRLMLIGPACERANAEALAARLCARFSENWNVMCEGTAHVIRSDAFLVHLFLEPQDTDNRLLDKLNYGLSVLGERKGAAALFFDEDIRRAMEHRSHILEELRYAIEQKTFQMYYQPIYNCKERRFTSAESLVRLFARDGSFISPGEFIPMAEENGLIDPISWIVLEKVCRFLGAHPELPLHTVSVNMTGQQVLDPTFTQRIETLLDACRLEGSRLRIEITERTVADDFDEIKRVMQLLAQRGVHFYLDDFGTGYSNLSSMLSLPFEVIKFDQSLIRIMDGTEQGRTTIGLLAQIMHENRYTIVAEGIETSAQAQTALENGLDRIQGFFYAKPLSEEALCAFFAEGGPAERAANAPTR